MIALRVLFYQFQREGGQGAQERDCFLGRFTMVGGGFGRICYERPSSERVWATIQRCAVVALRVRRSSRAELGYFSYICKDRAYQGHQIHHYSANINSRTEKLFMYRFSWQVQSDI